jgi:hypothetical protein
VDDARRNPARRETGKEPVLSSDGVFRNLPGDGNVAALDDRVKLRSIARAMETWGNIRQEMERRSRRHIDHYRMLRRIRALETVMEARERAVGQEKAASGTTANKKSWWPWNRGWKRRATAAETEEKKNEADSQRRHDQDRMQSQPGTESPTTPSDPSQTKPKSQLQSSQRNDAPKGRQKSQQKDQAPIDTAEALRAARRRIRLLEKRAKRVKEVAAEHNMKFQVMRSESRAMRFTEMGRTTNSLEEERLVHLKKQFCELEEQRIAAIDEAIELRGRYAELVAEMDYDAQIGLGGDPDDSDHESDEGEDNDGNTNSGGWGVRDRAATDVQVAQTRIQAVIRDPTSWPWGEIARFFLQALFPPCQLANLLQVIVWFFMIVWQRLYYLARLSRHVAKKRLRSAAANGVRGVRPARPAAWWPCPRYELVSLFIFSAVWLHLVSFLAVRNERAMWLNPNMRSQVRYINNLRSSRFLPYAPWFPLEVDFRFVTFDMGHWLNDTSAGALW